MKEKVFNIERGPDGEIVFSFKQPKFDFALSARGHLRTASRETLLALRSLVDDAISNLEDKEKKESAKKKTKIEVE